MDQTEIPLEPFKSQTHRQKAPLTWKELQRLPGPAFILHMGKWKSREGKWLAVDHRLS